MPCDGGLGSFCCESLHSKPKEFLQCLDSFKKIIIDLSANNTLFRKLTIQKNKSRILPIQSIKFFIRNFPKNILK